MNLQSGTRLGPYEIVSPIGAGGMGEVYRARDTRLGRTVAIKTLPAEFATDAKLKIRLEREAKAISALNHPHICTLYDVGDSYLVMEYCEGAALNERIAEGPLPIEDVLRYGAEIADALDKAHRQGIVHRDLKPSNIMLTEGGAKLLDFGLARRNVPSDEATTAVALTEDGNVVGTMQYMAPELLRGSTADPRSDVFAFGLVLYEMLTGKRAFDGNSKPAVIAAILENEPTPAGEINPKTPPQLELLVRACLAKDPDERVQTANDIRMQLRAISEGTPLSPRAQLYATRTAGARRHNRVYAVMVLAIALIAAAAGLFWLSRRTPATAPASIRSLVVLPFENLSTPDDEYLAAGMHDGLIAELSQLAGLRVISRTSAMHYQKSNKTIPEIARELNVDAIVEGSVLKSGDQIHVQAKLMRVRPDERQIWSKTYDRLIGGATAVQTDVARAIALAADVPLSREETARLARPRTAKPETYDMYLKGMYYVRALTPESAQKGLEYLNAVVAKDPSDPEAHAGLALAYSIISHGPNPPADVAVRAKAEAQKAIALDETVADAHAALGAIAMYQDWDWPTAGREIRRALQLNPNLAQAHRDLAWFVELPRLNAESIAEMKRARELDPLTRLYTSDLAWLYFRHGRMDESLREARAAAAMDPDWVGEFVLVVALSETGQHEEAIAIARRVVAKNPRSKFVLAFALAKAGQRAEAETIAADAAKSKAPAASWGLAYTYAALGNKDETLRWIEKGIDSRFSFMLWIKDNPLYAPLRNDPRFQAQVRRLNLPD